MKTLNATARETIRGEGQTIAGYVRFYGTDGTWTGDACGCVDDRCMGHHHDAGEDCGCVSAFVADMVREQTAARIRADLATLRRTSATYIYPTGLHSFELAELVSMRDAFDSAIAESVKARRSWGHTWEAIAADLNVSKQAAQQRYGK